MLKTDLISRPILAGQVPSSWELRRFKYSTKIIVEKPGEADHALSYIGLEHVESWTGRLLAVANEMEDSTSNVCRSGDVLFGKLRPYLAKAFMSSARFRCSSEFLVLRSKNYLPEFLKYILLSRDFINLVNSSTYGAKMPRASWDFIGDILMPVPAKNTQINIASFLDRETAKLDQLVEKKQRLIELLQEKHQALITQAVTKGLDPNVPMKDTGIPWLGEVPAHWEIRRLKHVASFQGGGTPSKDEITFWNGDIPWVSPKDMKRDVIEDTEDHISNEAIAASATSLVSPGSVLIVVRSGILKHSLPVAINRVTVTLNQDMKAISPANMVTSFFLFWLLKGFGTQVLFECGKIGATVDSIDMELLFRFQVPIAPLPEQVAISAFLENKCKSLDSLINKINSQIELLLEYRQALISAAVTGQIDVRQYRGSDAETVTS